MKRSIYIFSFIVIVLILAFWGCGKDASISITSLTANPTTVSPADSSTLSATVDYEGDGTVMFPRFDGHRERYYIAFQRRCPNGETSGN